MVKSGEDQYDIQPYTSQVTSTERPEQAIVDWILRETGTEVWFSEPLGILNANKRAARLPHARHAKAGGRRRRSVRRHANFNAQMLSLRLATVNSPTWRSRAYPLLRPVAVRRRGSRPGWCRARTPRIWWPSSASAPLPRTQFAQPGDSERPVSHGFAIQPKTYARSVRPRDTVLPGFDTETGSIDEGYSLQVSPLFSLDKRTVDAVIKCHIDQVERLVPVPLELPSLSGQPQQAQVQVPQLVSSAGCMNGFAGRSTRCCC